MNDENMEEKSKINKTYVAFGVIFVLSLVLLGIASSYAYYKLSIATDSTKTNANVKTDCIDISFTDDTVKNEDGSYKLDYNYPITDSFALSNVSPITIKVKNNCSANVSDVYYSLVLTTLRSEASSAKNGYMNDDVVRFNIKKQIGEDVTEVKETNYLNTLSKINPDGTNYQLLINEFIKNNIDISNITPYIVESGQIANNEEITYKIYLWVDYYEGDSAMYGPSPAVHDTSKDGSTKNKELKTLVSLLVNLNEDLAE